jgi:hypothetical protein
MRGPIQVGVLVAALGACGGHPMVTPDGSTGGSDGGPPPSTGITVTWTTPVNMPVPGSYQLHNNNLTIDSVTFRVATFELIGDTGPSPETTKLALEAKWISTSQQPDPIVFDLAPPGVYSKLSAHLDGAIVDESLEIMGTIQFAGTGDVKPYLIHDRNDIAVSLDVSGMLAAKGSLVFPLQVDFAHALDAVSFETLAVDSGVLDLDTFDDQMPNFESTLIESFTSPHDGGTREH